MRALLWFLALATLAVALALAARYNTGYVLLVLPPWRMELSLNLMILLQLGGFILLYLLARLVMHALQLPGRVRTYREQRRQARAERALGNAIRYNLEGRYSHALKCAVSAHQAGHAPGVAALLAARAAHAMRDDEREKEWLARASEFDQETRNARLMTEAELYLNNRRFADAQGVIDVLEASGQRHIAALRLSLRAHQALGNWRDVVRLVRQLERHRALSSEQAEPIRLRAHLEILRNLAQDASALLSYWRGLSNQDRRSTRLASETARRLSAAGDCLHAQRIIEDALDDEWDSSLLPIYGDCKGGDILARIAQAENWLKHHPRDAQLLLMLGRLCRQQQLWGKAQSYLEASLSQQPHRATHIELAQLFDALDRPEDANKHYRKAASLAD
ncbi:MAG: heme biosynthesis protein HemY [Sterolibacterium sp.]|nr:heme biosynthesis protein HemY [Sterolibacterium sp.]